MPKRPTKAEREFIEKVASLGCCICGMPTEIHHKTGGGMALKSEEVMPLCPEHHRTGDYGVAIHAGVEEWERRHGTQDYWINWTIEQVGAI